MNYKIITDRIEVRSITENNKPRYIVKGTAMIANKKHVHEYTKQPDGSYKTLKSMFTPHCLESLKKQAKSRKVFIDTQHEMVRDASIKAMVKGKLTAIEQKKLDNMLNGKKLPMVKITDIDITDDRMDIEAEFNPMFREVDEDHQKYFDAVWYSLENKYLNGISVNLGNFEVGTDEKGDSVINDGELLGFSFLDGAAEPDNGIYEVAIRALEEGIEGGKMEEEKEKLEAEKAKLEEDKKKFDDEKAATTKLKEDEAAKKAEEEKQAEIKKQEEEQAKTKKELEEKAEALKKAEEEKAKLEGKGNSAKGVVKDIPPPAQPGAGEKTYNEEFYKENINDITSEHDNAIKIMKSGKEPDMGNSNLMNGFSRLTNLSTKISPTAGMSGEDAAIVQGSRLLERSAVDIVGKAQK